MLRFKDESPSILAALVSPLGLAAWTMGEASAEITLPSENVILVKLMKMQATTGYPFKPLTLNEP